MPNWYSLFDNQYAYYCPKHGWRGPYEDPARPCTDCSVDEMGENCGQLRRQYGTCSKPTTSETEPMNNQEIARYYSGCSPIRQATSACVPAVGADRESVPNRGRSPIVLKAYPAPFAAVRDGRKKFEHRKNDRNYQVGDMVVLNEFDPETEKFTHEAIALRVTYVLDGGSCGQCCVQPGYCVLSLEEVEGGGTRWTK